MSEMTPAEIARALLLGPPDFLLSEARLSAGDLAYYAERARAGDPCDDGTGRCIGCGVALERVDEGATHGCPVCDGFLQSLSPLLDQDPGDEDDA